MPPVWKTALIVGLLLLAGSLPLVGYWLALGDVPTLTAEQAIQVLSRPGSTAVLLDLREPAAFAALHPVGARSLPLGQGLGWASPAGLALELQGKELILLSPDGWDGAVAARRLRGAGLGPLYNLRGGMQEWLKASYRLSSLSASRLVSAAGVEDSAYTPLPLLEQAAQALAGLWIKPLYMLASLGLMVGLLRCAAPDLRALGWGLLLFFVGEFFCYLNFFAFQDSSYLCEYLHSFGMAAGFGFVFYALLEGVETRLLRLDQPGRPCAAAGLCRVCARQQAVTCRARRLYQLGLPALLVLSSLPLAARLDLSGTSSSIFGVTYYYGRFAVYQLYEARVLPLIAALLLSVAWVPLWFPGREPAPWISRVCLCAGLGGLAFALLRLFLGALFSPNLVWYTFWEELTELLFTLATAGVLWVFRRALFPRGFAFLK